MKITHFFHSNSHYFYALLYFSAIPIFGLFYNQFGSFNGFDSGLPFIDSIYFSVITITTLGYGDFKPIDDVTKILCSVESLGGIVLFGIFLNSIAVRTKSSAQEAIDNQYKKINNHINYKIHNAIEKPLHKAIRDSLFNGPKTYVYYNNDLIIAHDVSDINIYFSPEINLVEKIEAETKGIKYIIEDYIDVFEEMLNKINIISGAYIALMDPEIINKLLKLERTTLDLVNTLKTIDKNKSSIDEMLLLVDKSLILIRIELKEMQKLLFSKATKIESREEHSKKINEQRSELAKLIKSKNVHNKSLNTEFATRGMNPVGESVKGK